MKSSRRPSAPSASASASGMLTSPSPESAAACGASGGRVGAAFFVLEGMTTTLGIRIVFISSAVSYYSLGWSIGFVVVILAGKLVPLTFFFFWSALFGGYDKVNLLYSINLSIIGYIWLQNVASSSILYIAYYWEI
jgi:hypothetical protein